MTAIDHTERKTRALELEREVAAADDDVWEALTTGPGLERWFPLQAKVEPGEGGAVWLSWGPGCEGEAPIHVWQPSRRFGWTETHGADEEGRPIEVAVDFHVEGREGSTIVRIVQSGLSADAEWDESYDALKDGWTYFLFNLDFHFRRHGGAARTMIWRRHPTHLPREEQWSRLVEAGLVSEGADASLAESGASGAGGPADTGSPEIRLNGTHPTHPVSARAEHHFAAVLPDLNDSLWFVELEGRHVGFWLSVYDDDGLDVAALQTALDEKAGTVLG